MTGALFKHGTAMARDAALRLSPSDGVAEGTASPDSAKEPSLEEQEIVRLRERAEVLEGRLAALEADWESALEAERVQARQEAAVEHKRDDERVFKRLEQALSEAGGLFEQRLSEGVEPLAAGLAATAFRRLVEITGEEEDWLGRVIARRLQDLVSESVVTVRVSPEDADDALAARLRNHVSTDDASADGGALVTDASLPAGTARIDLTLGGIDICPGEGADALASLLDRAGGNFG